MNIRNTVGSLIGELRDNISRQGLGDRKDVSALMLSRESMDDASIAAASAAKESLDTVIADSINMIVSNESDTMHLTTAQRDAARKIASLAIDPTAGMQAIANAKSPSVGANTLSIEAQELGVVDALDGTSLSTEAFDGQSLSNAMYFSIAYNLFSARQDEFGETFFPTITIDPSMAGIKIGTDVTSIYKDFQRTVDGAPNKNRFSKVTLAKAIYDNNLMGGDRNKVVPVSRAANAAMLIPALEYVDNTSGEAITTAPLQIGKTIGLLGISQTDAMLAKGTMDAYDTLDRSVTVKSIIVSLSKNIPADTTVTPNIAAHTVTEYFRVPISMLPYSNFKYTVDGHEKDLNLSFDSTDIVFSTSTTVMSNGAASTILGALPAGHTVKLHIKLNGDGNTEYGDIAVYAAVAAVDSIYDAAGNALLTTSATYATIDTEFQTLSVDGYELDAYLTNSNLRKQGQLVTIDHFEQLYAVPVRSGVSVVMPVNSSDSNDSRLVGQVQTTGYRMNLSAIETLVSYADNLRSLTVNGANTNIGVMGVGRYHVDAYFSEATLDMATSVDSESSSERAEDIRAALVANVRDEVYRAYNASKYSIAHGLVRGDAASKVGVIVGTSLRVRNYIADADGKIDLGAEFDVKVVATPSTAIGDSMYITFSDHASGDRHTVVDPISFGQCLWAPTITTDIPVTMDGAVTRRFQTHPRYLHVVNLPIMVRINVTNIAAVLGRVTALRHAV